MKKKIMIIGTAIMLMAAGVTYAFNAKNNCTCGDNCTKNCETVCICK